MTRHDPIVRSPGRDERLDVLHSITGLNTGGAEIMLLRLLAADRHHRLRQRVLSLLDPGAMLPAVARLDIPVESLGMRRQLPGPRALARLARIATPAPGGVLHGWMYHGNLAATALHLRHRSRSRLVWSVHHSLSDIAHEKPLSQRLIRLSARLSRLADAIIYVSETSARQHEAIGFDPRRRIIIPNGTDTEQFQPRLGARDRLCQEGGFATQRLIVGSAARLHPMKDHAGLIRAAALAVTQGVDLQLVLAGEGVGPADPAIAKALRDTGIGERISFLGLRHDMAEVIPGFDLYASSSAFGESLPLVVAEAMACEVPCIVTDIGDCAHLVGDSGDIISPRDPVQLAAAIRRFAGLNPEQRKAIGVRARQRIVDHFAIDHVARRYWCLYRTLAEGRAIAAPDPA